MRRTLNKYLIMIMAFIMMLGNAVPVFAAKKEIPITKVSFPKTITLKKGESKTLNVSVSPANTTYKIDIQWGYQVEGKFTCKDNGSGSYWGQPSSEVVTGQKPGTGYLFTTVNIHNSQGKFIKTVDFETKVTVSSNNKSESKKPAASKNSPYLNVSEAYTLTNQFRTTKKNQWYWNSNNKTKKKTPGLKKLKKDANLEKIAKLRAKEQWIQYYENGRQTHTRPNGKKWWTAFPKGSKPLFENLGWGHTSCKEIILNPDYGWAETNCSYKGQGHRRAMLSQKAKRVGIACYKKNGKTCWAMALGY